jgi:SAM-dependent methyltransferase
VRTWLDRLAGRRAERLAARLAPHLPRSGGALDVGSGTGHNALALRRATGLDVRETDVVDFHAVGPGPILCGDGRLPFADDAFDAAVVCHVLSFSADPAALLEETARVARRVVVVQSTCRGRLGRATLAARGFVLARVAFFVARAVRFVPSTPFPMRRRRDFTRREVRAAARAAGLALVAFEADARPAPLGGRDLFVLERPQ